MLTSKHATLISITMAIVELLAFYAVFYLFNVTIPAALLAGMFVTLACRSLLFCFSNSAVKFIATPCNKGNGETLRLRVIPIATIVLLLLVNVGYLCVYGYIVYAYAWSLFFSLVAATTVTAGIAGFVILTVAAKSK